MRDHDVGVGKEEGRAWSFADLDLGNALLPFVFAIENFDRVWGFGLHGSIVSSFFPLSPSLVLGRLGLDENFTPRPAMASLQGPGFGNS
jgi:hypothetical protein